MSDKCDSCEAILVGGKCPAGCIRHTPLLARRPVGKKPKTKLGRIPTTRESCADMLREVIAEYTLGEVCDALSAYVTDRIEELESVRNALESI